MNSINFKLYFELLQEAALECLPAFLTQYFISKEGTVIMDKRGKGNL